MANIEESTGLLTVFKPNNLQTYAKVKLHFFAPSHLLGTLTPDKLYKIKPYIYPITLEDIKVWTDADPVFWLWFTTPTHLLEFEKMKPKAINILHGILDGEITNVKEAELKLKAVKIVMDSEDKMVRNVTKNTTNNIAAFPEVPKSLVAKSNSELKNELTRLNRVAVDEEGEQKWLTDCK